MHHFNLRLSQKEVFRILFFAKDELLSMIPQEEQKKKKYLYPLPFLYHRYTMEVGNIGFPLFSYQGRDLRRRTRYLLMSNSFITEVDIVAASKGIAAVTNGRYVRRALAELGISNGIQMLNLSSDFAFSHSFRVPSTTPTISKVLWVM